MKVKRLENIIFGILDHKNYGWNIVTLILHNTTD